MATGQVAQMLIDALSPDSFMKLVPGPVECLTSSPFTMRIVSHVIHTAGATIDYGHPRWPNLVL